MSKTGVEFDFVVNDSLKALALYEMIFEVERLEVTDVPTGLNEAVFSIFGTRFHLLDENPDYGLEAPAAGMKMPFWFNIKVPEIKVTFEKAIEQGCTEIQPVTELPDYGVSNAIFADPFGYVWMLHQIHKEVSFEERMKLWDEGKD